MRFRRKYLQSLRVAAYDLFGKICDVMGNEPERFVLIRACYFKLQKQLGQYRVGNTVFCL